MGSALDTLLETWKGHSPSQTFHPIDAIAINQLGLRPAFDQNLAPYPYVGDLRCAKVWILMRNPGVGANDAWQERSPPLDTLLADNLTQQFGAYPYLHLSPAIEGTDASNYWMNKRGFQQLARQVAQKYGLDVARVRQTLAANIAILECCAYRSRGFRLAMSQLPSSKLAQRVAREAITEGSRTMLMPWNAAPWHLGALLNADCVVNSEAQAFTFKMGAVCGFGEAISRAIFERA